MARIIIESNRLEALFEHATAKANVPNGDENAYGKEVARDVHERLIHAYFRKAFMTGQVTAFGEANKMINEE